MEIKQLEIRDRHTFIPVLAIEVSGADGYLLRRAGFGHSMVILVHLEGMKCNYDAYQWSGSRTMKEAHNYIQNSWDSLSNGDVVDVEFLLGEAPAPKTSKAVHYPI